MAGGAARGRSIPACAGEPDDPLSCAGRRPVHPRVRGGASASFSSRQATAGPSPRARGSPHPAPVAVRRRRSIPACAGEPGRGRGGRAGRSVHPRVRGGASTVSAAVVMSMGPSPRARGSRWRGWSVRSATGSIPACAGEPGACCPRRCRGGVHPRVRGGAPGTASGCCAGHGPSPRARGSPVAVERDEVGHGSIPACAGEPPSRPGRSGCRWVHPRVRGGAAGGQRPRPRRLGPSPRARGSL